MNNKEIYNTIAAYKRLFDTHDGQLVLQDLKSRCYYDKSISVVDNDGHMNTTTMVGLSAKRDIVLHIMNNINFPIERMEALLDK